MKETQKLQLTLPYDIMLKLDWVMHELHFSSYETAIRYLVEVAIIRERQLLEEHGCNMSR